MKPIIFQICCFFIYTSIFAQPTFSNIIDLEQGYDQLPTDLLILNNNILVTSVHNCAEVSGSDPCTSLSFFEFSGQMQDIKLIKNFRHASGSSTDFESDIIRMIGIDDLNNRSGITHIDYHLSSNQIDLGRTNIDTLNSYVSEGMLSFNNSLLVFGMFNDTSPGIKAKVFISKWDKNFEKLESFWSYLNNTYVSMRDLTKTSESSLVFIASGINPGPSGGLPLHIIKIDTLGGEIAELNIDSRVRSINLAKNDLDELYFNIDYAFKTSIAKVDKDLDEILWELTLPVYDHIIDQRYTIEDIIVANNGDVIFCGEINCQLQNGYRLVGGVVGRISSEGELLWLKILANDNFVENSWDEKYRDSFLTHLKELPNGKLVAMGQAWQLFLDYGQERSLWLLTMDENGCFDGFDCEDDIYVLNTGESMPILNNISELKSFGENLIFPNPVKDVLNVKVNGGFTYEIQNSHGKLLQSGNSENEIEVSQLPSGIYFLQLSQRDKLYQATKFIKL